jgi:hypothetical protein
MPHEIVKKMWVYIQKNGLQDKQNRRMINADAAETDFRQETRFPCLKWPVP